MREPQLNGRGPCTRGERGGARINLLLFAAFAALVGYGAYNYAIVAYRAFIFKDFMQETVDKAAYAPGQPLNWIETQLRAKAEELDLPDDAAYTVQNQDNHLAARVRWTRPVPMPGFVYVYEFDHTAKSSSLVGAR